MKTLLTLDVLKTMSSDELEDYRVMVVFKEIFDAVELVKLGYSMKEIVISGMYAKDNENKVKAEACLFVDDKDKEAFRFLEDHGVLLTQIPAGISLSILLGPL